MSTPVRVRVRMYQVGFGDCILISVEYDAPLDDGRDVRHLLIDFGTTRGARDGRVPGRMADVAALIQRDTGGVLDALAVTHRHKDHLYGFGVETGAKVLRELAPKRVLRPWTEHPAIADDARGPADAEPPKDGTPAEPVPGPGAASARFAALLGSAQEQASTIAALAGVHASVQAEAREQIKNQAAIALLDELSGTDRGVYLYAGADAGLAELFPGLNVTVLGPPTVEQHANVASQRERHEDYWMLALNASLSEATSPAHDDTPIKLGPGPVRWLVDRLASHKSHSIARLVRDLDDALNNTSLVLLLEIGGLSMLFPGDAQIENWEYTLDRLGDEPELKKRLTGIDLYKVGHHGSRNATPRSLHALWADRPDDLPRMASLMSTQPEVHGKSEATKVPRATLVAALREVSDLYSTDDLDKGEEAIELVADIARGPFRRVLPS